ncbi:MAG: hypothetical protein Q8L29_03915 [archaeon]|nr:hypothetical protein [archaeon]
MFNVDEKAKKEREEFSLKSRNGDITDMEFESLCTRNALYMFFVTAYNVGLILGTCSAVSYLVR